MEPKVLHTPTSSTQHTQHAAQTMHRNVVHVDHAKAILPHMPHMLPPENDEGYREYKLKLINLEEKRFTHLVTQMKFRIMEGGGEAIYEIGVADDGTPDGLEEHEMQETLTYIRAMAQQLKAECTILCERIILASPQRRIVEMSVRQKALETYLGLNTIFVAACFVVEGADDDVSLGGDIAGLGDSSDFGDDDEEYYANEFACSIENLQYNMESSQDVFIGDNDNQEQDSLYLEILFDVNGDEKFEDDFLIR